MKPYDVGSYIHRRAMEKVEAGEGDYWRCFHAVLDGNTELKLLYLGMTKPKVNVSST